MSTLHERLVARIDRSDEHQLIASWNAVRAVVELHAPAGIFCAVCFNAIEEPVSAPCPTIEVIARCLGVEIGETP